MLCAALLSVYRWVFTFANSCFWKTRKSADNSKTAISYWQLADPVGPYSFASPTCAGFAYELLKKVYHRNKSLPRRF